MPACLDSEYQNNLPEASCMDQRPSPHSVPASAQHSAWQPIKTTSVGLMESRGGGERKKEGGKGSFCPMGKIVTWLQSQFVRNETFKEVELCAWLSLPSVTTPHGKSLLKVVDHPSVSAKHGFKEGMQASRLHTAFRPQNLESEGAKPPKL